MIKLRQEGNPLYCSPRIEGWPDGPVTVKGLKELLELLPDDYTVVVNCIGRHRLSNPYITSYTPCYTKDPTTYELVFDIEQDVKAKIRAEVDGLLEDWGNE